jgi:hypothetical protein
MDVNSSMRFVKDSVHRVQMLGKSDIFVSVPTFPISALTTPLGHNSAVGSRSNEGSAKALASLARHKAHRPATPKRVGSYFTCNDSR